MPEQPEQKQETVREVVAAMRRYAELVASANADISPELAQLLREYADRVERAAERDYEDAKAYFEKLHDGPSMICTAKNCHLRNAAEDIVEQVKAEASLGHFAPVVVEERREDGNARKMRAALLRTRDIVREIQNGGRISPGAFISIIEDALAAPARNCDRFAVPGKAWLAYKAECDKDETVPNMIGAISWLLDTAEGGAERRGTQRDSRNGCAKWPTASARWRQASTTSADTRKRTSS